MKRRRDDRKKTLQALTLITQLGLVMIVSIGMTTALGIWLDKRLGTSFLTVILFFVGVAAGFQGAYRTIRQIFKDEEGDKERRTPGEDDRETKGKG